MVPKHEHAEQNEAKAGGGEDYVEAWAMRGKIIKCFLHFLGTLIFEDEQDLELTVSYMVVNGGRLQIGTAVTLF